MKQSNLHLAKVRVGAYNIPNSTFNGDLPLSRVVADFLIAKGLVTTTDYCTFTLAAGPVDFNFAYDSDTQIISLTINGETQEHTLAFETSQITTSSSIIINGVSYPAGSILQTVLNAINAYINFVASTAAIIYGPFEDDDAAGVGGVPLGKAYELTADNPYGMPQGMVKIRKT